MSRDACQCECVGPAFSDCDLTYARQHELHLAPLLTAVLDLLLGRLIDLLQLVFLLRIRSAQLFCPSNLSLGSESSNLTVPLLQAAFPQDSACMSSISYQSHGMEALHEAARQHQPSSRHCRGLCSASDRGVKDPCWPCRNTRDSMMVSSHKWAVLIAALAAGLQLVFLWRSQSQGEHAHLAAALACSTISHTDFPPSA